MNPQQEEAVRFDHGRDGDALVLAGAGSGKTTVLARRVAHLMSLAPSRDGAQGILALTFTADAAREMRERVGIPGGSAYRPGQPRVATFHAFAYGLLRAESGGAPNWRRLGFSACPSLLEPAARRAWLSAEREALGLDDPMDILERRVARPLSGREDPDDPLRARFRARLLGAGAVAFDDMVALALRLLREHPGVLAGLRAEIGSVLVDEFQDTSPDQLELVDLILGGRRGLFLVGDDDQSIYGFRGADPGNVEAALRMFPSLRVLKLETNYRSTAPIVDFANGVFADKPERLRKVLRPGRSPSGGEPVRVMIHGDGMEQARWMAAEIARLRAGGMAWDGIAILYRLNALEPYYRSLLRNLLGGEAAEGVVLKTIHGAKGLQWPAVFLAGLEDGILPYHRPAETIPPDRLAEEKRVFYVGVTRAERHLYLCACRRRVLRGKRRDFAPCPFLGRK